MGISREELIGCVDQYLEALAANDPSRLKVTPGVRYTENGQVIPLGYGLWANAEAREPGGHYFTDTQTGQVGFLGVVRELGSAVMLGLRLKVEDGRISEAEHIAVRPR